MWEWSKIIEIWINGRSNFLVLSKWENFYNLDMRWLIFFFGYFICLRFIVNQGCISRHSLLVAYSQKILSFSSS